MASRHAGRGLLLVVAAIPLAVLTSRRRRRARRGSDQPAADGPTIVLAGAGFANVAVLRELHRALPERWGRTARIRVIDRSNYHLFTPLLYQVATGSVDPLNIAYPLRPFCAELQDDFLCATIRSVNLIDQYVETDAGRVDYDYLVLGLGSQTNYFGMQEVEQRSLGLKTLKAASAIRSTIIDSVERAAQCNDPERRKHLLTFAVVGAGATGVELVNSLDDLLRTNLLPYYDSLKPGDERIILIEAMESILPGVDERMRRIALRRLDQLGVDLRLKTAVAGISDGAVVTRSGERIPAGTIIWTAGIRPNPVTAGLAVEKSRDGRIIVDEHLRIPGSPNTFALGDNAYVLNPATGKPLPANASVAVREGRATGRNLARLVAGKPIEPFVFHSPGEMIALGRKQAAAQLGPLVFGGLPAWFVWRVYHLSQIMGIRSRFGIALDWIAALFSRRYIANTGA